ncbi:MAG: hypothetical protein MZW92_45895 [Comamonadaceae bacterium]|nr:hypothetical protein [Comamonadaceae bacterium]
MIQKMRARGARSSRQSDDPLLEIAREARGDRAQGRLLRRAQALPERGFLLGHPAARHGLPDATMFTAIFALARTAGWVSHWLELQQESHGIDRPRQLYVGHQLRHYPADRRLAAVAAAAVSRGLGDDHPAPRARGARPWRALALLALAVLSAAAPAADDDAAGPEGVPAVAAAGDVVTEIRFVGNRVTREHIMRQEMVIAEGDVVDPLLIERSRQAIMDLGPVHHGARRARAAPGGRHDAGDRGQGEVLHPAGAEAQPRR